MFLNIFTQPQHALTCSLSFKIIDKVNSKFDLKIKEALHINWRKPNLNAQQNHFALTLSLQLASPLCSFLFSLFCFFCFVSLSSIVFIISTLIIGIFYSINYTLLLLPLIITHLVNTFYHNDVINICPSPSYFDLYKYH